MLNPRLDLLTDYPFQRLTDLLGGPAKADSIVMSIGEPQHVPPAMVAETLARRSGEWGKYPPANGTAEFRQAVSDWLTRRFVLPTGMVDGDTSVLPVAGTREALYLIAQIACGERLDRPPVVLLPNPFYQVYSGAALMAGAEPVFVPGANGPLSQPDFSALPADILGRAALAYLCTPANPQGSVADLDLLTRTVEAARRYDFILAADECYSEIWDRTPPPGTLTACARLGAGTKNVLVFHSLSKRSSVPGLRSGFVAGDPRIIAAFTRLRSYAGAVTPLPVLAAASMLWRDETHVEESRSLYRAKFDIADRVLGDKFEFRRPPGGFFLWLNVGDGEQAAVTLWQKADIRVLPGAYLARGEDNGLNPGHRYIRVALVHDLETTEWALRQLVSAL